MILRISPKKLGKTKYFTTGPPKNKDENKVAHARVTKITDSEN